MALALPGRQLPGRGGACPGRCPAAAQPRQPQRPPAAAACTVPQPSSAAGLAWRIPGLLPAAAAVPTPVPLGAGAGAGLEWWQQRWWQAAPAAGCHSCCRCCCCSSRSGGAAAVLNTRGPGLHLEPAGHLTRCHPCRLTAGVRECGGPALAAAAALTAGGGACEPSVRLGGSGGCPGGRHRSRQLQPFSSEAHSLALPSVARRELCRSGGGGQRARRAGGRRAQPPRQPPGRWLAGAGQPSWRPDEQPAVGAVAAAAAPRAGRHPGMMLGRQMVRSCAHHVCPASTSRSLCLPCQQSTAALANHACPANAPPAKVRGRVTCAMASPHVGLSLEWLRTQGEEN